MVRPEPWLLLTHHILPTYNSSGAPLGLSASFDGSWRPSRPNQLPQRAGNGLPSFVRLPWVFTRNTPLPGTPIEDELDDNELTLELLRTELELTELEKITELDELLRTDELLGVLLGTLLDERTDDELDEPVTGPYGSGCASHVA